MAFETYPLPKDLPRPPETVLVNITPQETRVAILEENNICELHIERNSEHSLVGNIYLGIVRRVLPGMQSAFVDVGLERAAFLHIMDIVEQRQNPESNQRIEHVLFEGQTLLVQVIKDPINSKGARLSTQISLAGRFLVHLPQDKHIGISQRSCTWCPAYCISFCTPRFSMHSPSTAPTYSFGMRMLAMMMGSRISAMWLVAGSLLGLSMCSVSPAVVSTS